MKKNYVMPIVGGGRKERKKEEREKEERRIKEEVKKKQRQDDTKPSSSSTFLSLVGLATNDDDQIDLISSLSNLIQKNKTIKSLQKTLMEVTYKLHSTLEVQHIKEDPKQRAQLC